MVLRQQSESSSLRNAKGPLAGIRVVEFSSIGPGPFAGMMLSDMGADVVRIERAGRSACDPDDPTARGRHLVSLDLKDPAEVRQALALLDSADVLLEGYRPGVMERLGLGPDIVLERNPRLVYGRVTGWGQEGPLSTSAGHDLNYIALTGALAAIGTPGQIVPPLNLAGDYGGGALYLVVGVLAALLEARRSGEGQVVDAAMCDGAVSMMTLFYQLHGQGKWRTERGSNLLDGGAHFYRVYECSDGKHIAIGAIEPQFYALLREKMGLTDPAFDHQNDESAWPDLAQRLGEIVRLKTRAQWCEILEGTDACVSPVLDLQEAPAHPHLVHRQAFLPQGDRLQPAPAPRFSRTQSAIQSPPPSSCLSVDEVLGRWRAAVSLASAAD